MSKRKPATAPARTPNRRSSTAGSVGARAFNRRAQAARQRATRKPTRKRPRPGQSFRVWEMLRGIPRAALLCALVACLNAACWSIITPPFQVPDEPSHFAYTQLLAEDLRLPTSARGSYSVEESTVLHDLHQLEVLGNPNTHTISSATEQQILQEDLDRHLSRHGEGGLGGVAADPPLYPLLEMVPYGLASGGSLLDQLELMRLQSALLAGLTALFVFLFVRETLPAVRWAWTAGGLGVALMPLLGFMSGSVNPDSMLFAVSAAIFYCIARAFRRGLTRRGAVAIGSLTAVGVLTKLNFIGLAPGVILALIVLTVRATPTYGRRVACISLGLALAIAASPACLYLLINLLSGHPGLGIVSTTLNLGKAQGSIFGKISYVWQLYLPRLPGMTSAFPGLSTTRHLWFDRSVGMYGWLDTTFPTWVDTVALVPAGAVGLLCVRALVVARSAVRQCFLELIVYAVMSFGLLVLIGLTGYFNAASEGVNFAEPRYLLPLLPLLAVVFALAARGAGRRWGPAVGAAIVVLLLAHDVFSQLLVIGRYYG